MNFCGCVQYMQLVISCKFDGYQIDGFYAANAWSDVSKKLKIKFAFTRCRRKQICFPDKNMSVLETIARRFNYKHKFGQSSALPLNGMHLLIPSTEYRTIFGPQLAQARPVRPLLMRGRSQLGQSSWHMAMVTQTILTERWKAWSMIVTLIPVYDNLISSQFPHSSGPN